MGLNVLSHTGKYTCEMYFHTSKINPHRQVLLSGKDTGFLEVADESNSCESAAHCMFAL